MHSPHQNSNATMRLLLFCVFLDLLAVGLIIPVFPHLSKKLGLSNSSYGMLMSLYGVSQLIGSSIMGNVSDRWGRKAVLLLNCLGTGVAYALLGLCADNASIALFAASRLLVGLVKQTSTVATAYVADVTCSAGRSASLASLSSVIHMGLIVGPALSGVMQSRFGDSSPCFASAALFILDFFVIYFALPDARGSTTGTTVRQQLAELVGSLKSPRSRGLLLCAFFYYASNTLLHTGFALTLEGRFKLNPRNIAYTLSFNSFLSVLVQGLAVGPASRWIPERQLLPLACFVTACCYAAEALAPTFPLYLVALGINTVPAGVFHTCFTSTVTKSFPAGAMGGALGAFGTVESLNRIAVPALSGLLMDAYSPVAPTALASLLSVVLAVAVRHQAQTHAKIQ